MKQETIEEAAENYANTSFTSMLNLDGEPLRIPVGQSVPCGFKKHKKIAIKHFTNGAKWQQERSYNEEDIRKAFIAGFTPKITTTLNDSFNKWFEQFKNNNLTKK